MKADTFLPDTIIMAFAAFAAAALALALFAYAPPALAQEDDTPAFGTPLVEFVERAAGPVTEAARSIADAMRAHGTWSVQLSGQGG